MELVSEGLFSVQSEALALKGSKGSEARQGKAWHGRAGQGRAEQGENRGVELKLVVK